MADEVKKYETIEQIEARRDELFTLCGKLHLDVKVFQAHLDRNTQELFDLGRQAAEFKQASAPIESKEPAEAVITH